MLRTLPSIPAQLLRQASSSRLPVEHRCSISSVVFVLAVQPAPDSRRRRAAFFVNFRPDTIVGSEIPHLRAVFSTHRQPIAVAAVRPHPRRLAGRQGPAVIVPRPKRRHARPTERPTALFETPWRQVSVRPETAPRHCPHRPFIAVRPSPVRSPLAHSQPFFVADCSSSQPFRVPWRYRSSPLHRSPSSTAVIVPSPPSAVARRPRLCRSRQAEGPSIVEPGPIVDLLRQPSCSVMPKTGTEALSAPSVPSECRGRCSKSSPKESSTAVSRPRPPSCRVAPSPPSRRQ